MSIEYTVQIEPYAERHFIRTFKRKYKGAWDITMKALIEEFRFFDLLAMKSAAEIISVAGNVRICKTEFKIAGRQESRHGSGNRCIVAVRKDTTEVHVLLVYGKTDISARNETAEWKRIVSENYLEYRDMCQ